MWPGRRGCSQNPTGGPSHEAEITWGGGLGLTDRVNARCRECHPEDTGGHLGHTPLLGQDGGRGEVSWGPRARAFPTRLGIHVGGFSQGQRRGPQASRAEKGAGGLAALCSARVLHSNKDEPGSWGAGTVGATRALGRSR